MHLNRLNYLFGVLLIAGLFSCKNKHEKTARAVIFKGLYSFGPEAKTFKDCATGQEFWVADSSAQLELKYSQVGFEKPDEPVYVEVEGKKVLSAKEAVSGAYDTTLIVKKVIKITKDIPNGKCN